MRIVLLGYMGSGKSVVGNYLAKKLNVKFIDLDSYIEEKENLSIGEIFSKKGEIYFRIQEGIYLKELLENESNFILSLGGGTPCYGNNMDIILNNNTQSIYLKASITSLIKNLENEKFKRPLIANLSSEKMVEFVGKHLFERAPFYEQATHKISIDNKSVEEVEKAILSKIHTQ